MMADSADTLSLDLKDLFTKFTNDVIATAAFGIQCNTLQTPDNEFYRMGKQFMKFSILRLIVFIGYTMIPKVMKMLGARIIPKKIADFFRTVVRDSIKFREREGIIKPDMIHLLMQVREDDLREDGSSSGANPESEISNMPDDTRGTKMMHQDIQQQVKDEIDEVLAEHGGQVTYEAVQRMRHLDNVVSETLRMYPPAPAISRRCVKEYHVPGSDLKLEKDSTINIPVNGLHHDPQFFLDPETFNPDRFSEGNKHNIQPFTYMPFGSGPRHCIANRFALLETKVVLVHLLSHFELHTTSKTRLPLQLSKSFEMTVEGGFWCGFKLRPQASIASASGHD
jgi:cytochrome P450 family 9